MHGDGYYDDGAEVDAPHAGDYWGFLSRSGHVGRVGVGLYKDMVGLSSVGSEEDFVNLVAEKENLKESVYGLLAHIYVGSIRALCVLAQYISTSCPSQDPRSP